MRTDRLLIRLARNRDLALFVIAAAIFAFFALTTKTFLREFNLFNILRNISLISIVAVGMTWVLIAGEIDLSVGSVYGFLTVVMGMLVVAFGLSPWAAMPIVILIGVGIGAVNGLFIIGFGIPSFIVTLAMLAGYRGLALIVSNERPFTPKRWAGNGPAMFLPSMPRMATAPSASPAAIQCPSGATAMHVTSLVWRVKCTGARRGPQGRLR